MYRIRHANFGLRTMEAIDVDWREIVDYLWSYSKFIKKHSLDKKLNLINDLKISRLDPGGMLNFTEKWIEFSLDGYLFEVQLSKIEWVSLKVSRAKKWMPGTRRIGMWMWNIVLSEELWEKLKKKVEGLMKSDEALHAQISDFEIKIELEEGGYMIFPDIPREPKNGE